jgi:hypothetical protein
MIQFRLVKDSEKGNNYGTLSITICTPVEEGLVFRAEDYEYSSATDYAGGKGLLDIFVIE